MQRKNYNLVLGVGAGVVVVGFFFVIGIVICILGRCSGNPMFMVIVGICLPILVFLIILAMPTESDRPKETGPSLPTDGSIIGRGFFFAFVFLMLILALFIYCAAGCFTSHKAIQVSTATKYKSSYSRSVKDSDKKDSALQNQLMKHRDRSKFLSAP